MSTICRATFASSPAAVWVSRSGWRALAHLVRGDQNRDDRHHDEYQDHEDEAEHHSAHRPPAQVGAGDPSYYPQHAVELLVPQVRATTISPATGRITVIGCHGLSMGVS